MLRFLRHILFFHITPLVRLGSKRPLTADDMPELEAELTPASVESDFAHIPTDRAYRFMFRAWWASGFSARRALFVELLRLPIGLASPFLLRLLLKQLPFLSTQPDLFSTSLVLTVCLALAVVMEGISVQHFYYYALMTYARVSNGLNLRVFRHALRMSRSAQMTTQTGDIVNHMASDTDGIAESSFFLPELLYSALLLIAILAMLTSIIGLGAFAALGTLMLVMPLARMVARRFANIDTELWKHRDRRVTLMSQILGGIRVIKYFAWERSVLHEVDEVRKAELHARMRMVKNDALATILFVGTTTLVSLAGFGTFVWTGGTLTVDVVFPCLVLFLQLEHPFGMLPHFIKDFSHARVAAERLHAFFGLGERSHDELEESAPDEAVSVSLRNLAVRYSSDAEPALRDVTLELAAGESLALVGPVGAGKSTLLLALLGECETNGDDSIRFPSVRQGLRPRIGYVPQEAFILNATVRENIVFGEESIALDDAIAQSAMTSDIAQMNAGLETEIGERGVNLSGGQKQRVALARTVMKRPGLVLLDDPLAAVDVHTESYLCEHLIFGRWKNVTRIVATHRLSHLSSFDRIGFVQDGRIVALGTLSELQASSVEFRAFYADHASAEEVASSLTLQEHSAPSEQAKPNGDGRLTDDEDRETGQVKAEVFGTYIRALGGEDRKRAWWVYTMMLFTCLLISVLPIIQNTWMGWWTDQTRTGIFAYDWMRSPFVAVGVYGLIGLLVLGANYMERMVWMTRTMVAGRILHNNTLRAVLAAPLRFFDTTPMGRILNRFARDMETVDDHLSWNVESGLRSMGQMLGSLVFILANVPLVIVFAIPALVIFYRVQRDYRRAAREAKRLESIARSPRYAHFKETITGLTVIRAFRKEHDFTRTFHRLLGNYQRQYWGNILLNRWFSVRTPIISGVIALATTVGAVLLIRNGSVAPGLAGVVITYALTFWQNLNWCVRAYSEVESRMTSVERLSIYSALEPETDVTAAITMPARSAFPTKGTVEFRDVWVRYAEHLPFVLKGTSFRVEGGSRVGIVGRTGSGKTTLFQTLFRFIGIERGKIMIDGVDIATVPLERLRRSIAVIPQDPTLFIGTVRSNLDRFGEYDDAAVLSALKRVQMHEAIEQIGGLNAAVTENGYNFSQGQRQLLCLARAILTGARIIVMDEATASVDVQTDVLIQQTIRTELIGATVLIIAHRLNSVADCDIIIQMNEGKAVLIGAGSVEDEEEWEKQNVE